MAVVPAGWRTLVGFRHREPAVLSELALACSLTVRATLLRRSERLVPAELGDRVAYRAEVETGGVDVLGGDRQRL